MYRAIKTLVLSSWGMTGSKYARYFDLDVANAITGYARKILAYGKDVIEDLDVPVFYGDTDSYFIKFHDSDDMSIEKIVKQSDRLCMFVNKAIRDYIIDEYDRPDSYVDLGTEKLFGKILFTGAKKRYAGQIVWDSGAITSYLEMIGFESRRSDWTALTRETEEKCFNMVLNEGKSFDDVNCYLETIYHQLMKGELDHKIVFSVGVNKRLEDYAVDQMHVRAAKKHPNIGKGDRVAFVVVSTGKKTRVEPVIEDRIPKITRSGYVYIWERQIQSAIERIFGNQVNIAAEVFETGGGLKRWIPALSKSG